MRFATIVLLTGLVGAAFAANLQGPLSSSVAEAAAIAQRGEVGDDVLDAIETGSLSLAGGTESDAIRLIDLRSGTTCRTETTAPSGNDFTAVPLSRDCKSSPSLSRIEQWRSTETGSLIMADANGATILEFAPGDGVLYESVYPSDQLITIVPARG